MRNDYSIGSIIEYQPLGGGRRTVLVDERERDIKNGRPGFAGQCVDPETLKPYPTFNPQTGGVWGYDAQITKVVQA